MSGLSAEKITELGGKSGLLRRFVDDATQYVWRMTGTKPEKSLVILRALRSAAGTNEAKTAAMIHTLYPEFSEKEIREVLGAFAAQYIVHQVPGEGQDKNDLSFEFIHEQMIAAIEEAPSPELIRVRDNEARRTFWTERAATMLVALPKTAKFAERLHHTFAAPIPLWEAAALLQGASVTDKRLLQQNQIGWIKRYVIGVIAISIPFSAFQLHRNIQNHTDNLWKHQIEIIKNERKSTAFIKCEGTEKNDYLELLIWNGFINESLETVMNISVHEMRSKTLSHISEALSGSNKTTEATNAASEALKAAKLIKNDNAASLSSALVHASEAFAKAGKISEATDTANEALEIAKLINEEEPYIGTIEDIAVAFAQANNIQKAFEVARILRNSGEVLAALLKVSEAFAKVGKIPEATNAANEALRIAKLIKDDDAISLSSTWVKVSEAFAKVGKIPEATNAANEALRVAKLIKDDDAISLSSTWVKVSEAFAKVGKIPEATNAANEALRVAKLIKEVRGNNPDYRPSALAKVSQSYAKAGNIPEATTIAEDALNILEHLSSQGNSNTDENVEHISRAFSIINRQDKATEIVSRYALYNKIPLDIISSSFINTKSNRNIFSARDFAKNATNGESDIWLGFSSKCSAILGQEKRAQEEATAVKDISYRLDAYNFLMREHLKRTNPKFRAVWEAEQKEKEDNED